MKKIPTLFKKKYDDKGRYIGVINEYNEGLQDIIHLALPTIKYDGSACMVTENKIYKRYDVKPGKKVPDGAIPCQDESDAVTGHFPVWVECSTENPADKWFIAAYNKLISLPYVIGTYEAVGPHFQGNPYNLDFDVLVPHGRDIIMLDLIKYEDIKKYLETHNHEGIVYWYHDEPICKIRRKDFGFEWPIKRRD